MGTSISDIIDDVIAREGRVFTNDAVDRGGPTKFGITQKTLAAWRGTAATAADVEALTEDEARKIYEREYVTRPGFEKVADDKLRALLVDAGVLHGPGSATKMLQQALKVPDDGVLGRVTLRAIEDAGAAAVYRRLAVQRIRFLGRLVTDRPDQARFCAGWMNRATEFLLD